ncbi:MAG: AAA family ATPase [Erysipelotrichaceae bacterium]|nr:AAA family ATPase [Erysipelotrichaceae bacterium]
MRNKEKEDLMEAVFGKNAKRRTLGSLKSSDIKLGDYSMNKDETEVLTDILKQQSEQINEMMKESSFSEADYQKLKREIELDFGVSLDDSQMISEAPVSKKLVMNYEDSKKMSEVIKDHFPGQEEFVDKLAQAMRKPYVLRKDEQQALFTICLCGSEGTGKKAVLKALVGQYASEGYLTNKELGMIDLSRYESSEQENLFVQDVYAALKKGDVILFDKLECVSPYLMPTLETLMNTGKLPLKKRYISNKGQLQEAGNTLVSSAIDSLSFAKKGIVFEADTTLEKLYGIVGTGFFKGFDDILTTEEFDQHSLFKIAEKKLENFALKCTELNLKVNYQSDVTDYLVRQYDTSYGINSFENELNQWLKCLLQIKLEYQIEEVKEISLCIENEVLMIVMNEEKLELLKSLNQKEAEQEQKILDELNEIVGLDEVKKYVLSLKDHFRIQKMRAQRGLKTSSVSMHMIFTGNPGTGKTTIARIISRYLKAIGILSSGQLIEVTRADLVGRYVGHTAPQTEQVMKSALGGVLFIDEAYSLYRGKDDSFGLEAIDTLVKGIEDYRDDLLVILAGYTKEMQEFLTSNSGLKSRFPNIIEFPDYTAEELLAITKSIAKGKQYVLHEDCDRPLLSYFETVQATRAADAGNGRLARNLVEAAILKQSSRCLKDLSAQLDELKAEDFDLSEV